MQDHKFSFIGLRDYIGLNHPDMVKEFDKSISNLTDKDGNVNISRKNNLREVINDYLARISSNEKLFNIVEKWKFEVLAKAQKFLNNDVYGPQPV